MRKRTILAILFVLTIALLLIAGKMASAATPDFDLYPGGYEPPAGYLDAAIAQLSGDNQIVIVGIGPSIMQNSLSGFIPFLSRPEVNGNIVFVDGSLGSNQQRFEDPDYPGWNVGINRLPAGLTAADVDIVFYYNQLTGQSGTFEQYVATAADSFELTYDIINDKFPNVRLILQNGQHYAGWCGQCKAPEPYAYWSGYAVKELIARRINGEISGAVIGWNAYQWDDTWPQNYYSDGLHLSGLGQQATGQLWHDYLSTSIHAAWYLNGQPLPTSTPTGTAVSTIQPTPSSAPGVTATPSPFPSSTPTGEPTVMPTVWCGRACQTATAQAGR